MRPMLVCDNSFSPYRMATMTASWQRTTKVINTKEMREGEHTII